MHTGLLTPQESIDHKRCGIDPEVGGWQTNSGSTDGIGPFDTTSVVAGLATDP